MNIKKHHVLLIAALATLGLSACDKSKSPEDGKAPAATESAMPDNTQGAADDGMNNMDDMSDTMDQAADDMDDMMDQMGDAAEDAKDDAEESMSEATDKLKQ